MRWKRLSVQIHWIYIRRADRIGLEWKEMVEYQDIVYAQAFL